MTTKNQLRIWLNRNGDNTYIEIKNVITAEEIIREAIKKDLKDDSIITNAFGLEIFEDNGNGFEWCEWYCEEGEYEGADIIQIIEEKDNTN